IAVPGKSEMQDIAPFPGGFPAEPTTGIAAGQSFGPLKAKTFPNSTPFDGKVSRLNVTIMPPQEVIAKPILPGKP
ncbi:MAG: hypothetical protein JNG86_07170, partial [Verrucomicrobiaceae bacterium]|nr:hypothetical protein [Verrucomicrobiaceae bacterium]